MSLAYEGKILEDCRNSDVYNSQLITKIKRKMISNPDWHKPEEKPLIH